MKKIWYLIVCAGLGLLLLTGCDVSTEDGTGEDGFSGGASMTASGEEYQASVNDDGSAYIEYLGDTLEIDSAEFVNDEIEGDFLCLHMTFLNDLGYVTYGDEDDEEYERSSLASSFVLQAIQDGKVIDHRSEAETETIEEDNTWEYIDEGSEAQCELYFPVSRDKPVTVQVLNPDGEDTVMAEIEYKLGVNVEESWE